MQIHSQGRDQQRDGDNTGEDASRRQSAADGRDQVPPETEQPDHRKEDPQFGNRPPTQRAKHQGEGQLLDFLDVLPSPEIRHEPAIPDLWRPFLMIRSLLVHGADSQVGEPTA
jgi:hypothetical protein